MFASAQNGAGKFATRAKLTSTSSKKKRPFWGNRRLEEVANEESDRDGEFDDSLWRRLWRAFDGGNSSSSWEWDLFLAESRMIIVSIIASVMCAFLPFIWYSMPGKRISARHDGEEGGGEFDVPSLIPPSSWYCLIVPFCLECLLASLLTQTHVSHKKTDVEDLVCDNPEQLKSGFFQSVEVGFENVGMVLKQTKKGSADRVILDGSISGRARPGRMLAIMGPSGR